MNRRKLQDFFYECGVHELRNFHEQLFQNKGSRKTKDELINSIEKCIKSMDDIKTLLLKRSCLKETLQCYVSDVLNEPKNKTKEELVSRILRILSKKRK